MKKIVKLISRVPVSDVPTFGSFVIVSYETDEAAFTDFSSIYDAAFLTDIKLKKKAIEALVFPKQLNGELKVVTLRIYSNQELVTNEMNYLEGYVKLTKGLSVGVKDFGFQEVRKANNSGNIEGVVSGLKLVTTNSGANILLLTPKGFTPAKQTKLVALMNTLDTDNVAQNAKLNERKTLVENNHIAINEFWNEITSICDIGKRIQKPLSKAKTDEYTINKVIARLRNDAKKTKASGVVAPKAKIVFKPLLGGRTRVAYSKPDGSYAIAGIAPNEYLATLIVKGKPNVLKTVVIEIGGHVVENF